MKREKGRGRGRSGEAMFTIAQHRGGLRAAASVVAPAVLFEEVELFTIEAEHQTLPIADAPHQRADAD